MPAVELTKTQRSVLQRMADAVGIEHAVAEHEDGLIGFFQSFRPDGNGLSGIYDSLSEGEELHDRLIDLFRVAGDDRRPSGGRDAYFVVRRPASIDPAVAESYARDWLAKLLELATRAGQPDAADRIGSVSKIRVLEGIAPKHPKQDTEKTELLKVFQAVIPQLVDGASVPLARALQTSYYYISCDPMLRDYLMWPLYREHFQLQDPFADYFLLWKHGIKYRIYQEQQIDLYLPRT